MVASLDHSCHLINGYSGFEPVAFRELERSLNTALQAENTASFSATLADYPVDIVSIDLSALGSTSAATLTEWVEQDKLGTVLDRDPNHLLLELP